MFTSLRSFGAEVVEVGNRVIDALQNILAAIQVHNRAVDTEITEQTQFRPLIESVEGLAVTLRGVAEIQREHGPATDRLDALELSRVRWEAECEGLLLKADGKLKAAAAAESRERQLKKSWERRDPFENGDGVERATEDEPAHLRDFTRGVQATHVIDAPPQSRKARALLAKWGR